MGEVSMCIVGWHYFDKFMQSLEKTSLDYHIVAHRHDKILDDLKLNHTVTENVGIEYGAFDWYIKNVWDKKSDVFFMHDDIDIDDIDNFIKENYGIMKRKQVDHGGVVANRKTGVTERFFYMSKSFIKILLSEYNGVPYDKENLGYTTYRMQPDHWYPTRLNDPGTEFVEMIHEIGESHKMKIYHISTDKRITLYSKGQTVFGEQKNRSEKDKIKRKKLTNARKKKRLDRIKEWEKKYGNKK